MASQDFYDLYLYLARRDKKSVQILARFLSTPISTARIDESNISLIGMPTTILPAVQQEIYDNRMLWQAWLETADSYESFRVRLTKSGYTNIPLSSQPKFFISTVKVFPKFSAKQTMVQKTP
jgi:hypothetical protein